MCIHSEPPMFICAMLHNGCDRILTVTEEGISSAMRMIWERMKIIIEPSSAVPVAAIMEHPPFFAGKKVGVIISGGNVDLDNLPLKKPSGLFSLKQNENVPVFLKQGRKTIPRCKKRLIRFMLTSDLIIWLKEALSELHLRVLEIDKNLKVTITV
ncbi:MAG: pyridoxal-phosphate dependent enzyme [Pseudomonadota bacterium]